MLHYFLDNTCVCVCVCIQGVVFEIREATRAPAADIPFICRSLAFFRL
jgi:hypothetical protein